MCRGCIWKAKLMTRFVEKLPFKITVGALDKAKRLYGLSRAVDNRTTKPWSIEDDKKVQEFFELGHTDSEIAAMLASQRTAMAVCHGRVF